MGHLEDCIDLLAAEAVYHKLFYARVCSRKDLTSPSEKLKRLGCPQKHSMLSAFNNLCDWLEEEVKLYTLGELHKWYDRNDWKWKWECPSREKTETKIVTGISGRKNVVCFREITSLINNDMVWG